MLRKSLLVIVVLLAVFAVVVALQPADYTIARSATIAAPAADAFDQVNDLRKMNVWSPWLELDPQAKTSYEGPQAGEGAAFTWNGNSDVGEGTMTIVESKPHERVRFRLDFRRPFESTADAEFTFKSQGDKTDVTWAMSGKKNFISKALSLFMSMDKMVGDNFEKGLSKMKTIVETPATK